MAGGVVAGVSGVGGGVAVVRRGCSRKARASPAVPSPSWREKQRKQAHRKAHPPMKTVRRWSGTSRKFRNWRRKGTIAPWLLR